MVLISGRPHFPVGMPTQRRNTCISLYVEVMAMSLYSPIATTSRDSDRKLTHRGDRKLILRPETQRHLLGVARLHGLGRCSGPSGSEAAGLGAVLARSAGGLRLGERLGAVLAGSGVGVHRVEALQWPEGATTEPGQAGVAGPGDHRGAANVSKPLGDPVTSRNAERHLSVWA